MMNPASNCVLMIIEDLSREVQGSVLILFSLLQATQNLSLELRSGVLFPLTAGSLWSPLDSQLRHCGTSTTFRDLFCYRPFCSTLALFFSKILPGRDIRHVLLWTVLQIDKHFLGHSDLSLIASMPRIGWEGDCIYQGMWMN